MAMTQTYPSAGNSSWGGSAGNASEQGGSSGGSSGSGILGAALPIITAAAGINPIVGLVLNTILGGFLGGSKKKETQQQYPVLSGKGRYMSDQVMNALMAGGGLGGSSVYPGANNNTGGLSPLANLNIDDYISTILGA